MPDREKQNSLGIFLKAKDLKVVVKFEQDKTLEGISRTKLAKEIICQLILLGQKKGRPSAQEDEQNEAA